jgi:hypothetical protein
MRDIDKWAFSKKCLYASYPQKETLYTIARRFGISPDSLSQKMGKPLHYQPNGTVLIRSQAHLFSPLLEINRGMLSVLTTRKVLESPSEIKVSEP